MPNLINSQGQAQALAMVKYVPPPVDPDRVIGVYILRTRLFGIVRTKGQVEPQEMEQLLIMTPWGASSSIDLGPFRLPFDRNPLTVEDCKKYEPGTVKYYVAQLPSMANPRPLGSTSITTYWLRTGKAFDDVNQALEAFNAGPNQIKR